MIAAVACVVATATRQYPTPIEHIVVLMMENRAFDHMVGHLHLTNPNVDGLTGSESNPEDPSDPNSPRVKIHMDAEYLFATNPGHSIHSTMVQLWGSSAAPHVDPAPMDGFVADILSGGGMGDALNVMSAYNATSVPAITTMANFFTLIDRWHASIPGPTEPNRMYALATTSDGADSNDPTKLAEGYPQECVFDDMYAAGVSFGMYYRDFPAATFLRHARDYPAHLHVYETFEEQAAAGTLPAFSWVEPRYFNLAELMEEDQHPHYTPGLLNGNVAAGEFFFKKVYDAVRNSPLWNKTMLLVTYDEHGGFFEHVSPPLAGVPSPDGVNGSSTGFGFDRLGLRVPAIVVSPWARRGAVEHSPPAGKGAAYEHSSIVKTARDLLLVGGWPLTRREAWAATFSHLVDPAYTGLKEPRTDCPTTLPIPPSSEELWRRYVAADAAPPRTPEAVAATVAAADPAWVKTARTAAISEWQQAIISAAWGLGGGGGVELADALRFNLLDAAVFVRNMTAAFHAKHRR